MITGAACFIAGLFFDHFYPVPAQLVRDYVTKRALALRDFFKGEVK